MTESSEASSESRGGGSGDLEEVSLIMNSSIVAVPVIEVPFFVVTPGTMETTSQSDVGFKVCSVSFSSSRVLFLVAHFNVAIYLFTLKLRFEIGINFEFCMRVSNRRF